MNESDRVAIRRKIQLASEKKNKELSELYGEQDNKEIHLPNEILNPDNFIQTINKIDAKVIQPSKVDHTFFSFWNTCPISASTFCLAAGSYMGMLLCAANGYSTHVLNKFAQWNSFSRVLVLAAVPLDAYFFWNSRDEIVHRYVNALRIKQRQYYESKWGIPNQLKDTMDQDPFWKEVESYQKSNSEENL